MRAVIQRVRAASVEIDGSLVAQIGAGIAVLVGVGAKDTDVDAVWLAEKTANLRIFEDNLGKMNLSLNDTGGEALVVSQFTLYADARKGRRPSFTDAAAPDEADRLYRCYVRLLRETGIVVRTGVFGDHMLVSIQNDGPATILLDTDAMMSKEPKRSG